MFIVMVNYWSHWGGLEYVWPHKQRAEILSCVDFHTIRDINMLKNVHTLPQTPNANWITMSYSHRFGSTQTKTDNSNKRRRKDNSLQILNGIVK